ncbi:helix-turn-helix domain-containing protein [Leucobacter allii]|uniref:AraC family transcriptional regulator n=1 Tax=Leucobacter allii TaxID=2932247 RepID=UPI001FD3AA1C|nr:GyrI-like domain-containing protein [Leucobacter allii]UOR00271.1 helix-turn-helix domain-containing protein [Leucobacter allii]
MIAALNTLIAAVEERPTAGPDLDVIAARAGTTAYHLRRMFSSLTGMPLSEYVRRRRMTLAAAEVQGGAPLLEVAVRYGYGSAEAFGRAFRAVHGASPGELRRAGGPLRTQSRIRLRLTVEGNTAMDARIVERPAFRLAGHAARVPLIHRGINPHIQAHIAALPAQEHARLRALGDGEPAGLLQVSDDVDPDFTEGSELTYLHGVALGAATRAPDDLDVLEVAAGSWVVFRVSGPYPAALQECYAASAAEWFPSTSWCLRPGPSIVAVLERSEDFRTATTELWLPVERGERRDAARAGRGAERGAADAER